MDEKIKYAKWKAADIARAYREGRVPQPGPAQSGDGNLYATGDRPVSPPSDLEDMSMTSSSAAGLPPSPPKPDPTEIVSGPASSTANSSSIPKTPLKSPGWSDGTWSTSATPGIESPNTPSGSRQQFLSSATLAKLNLGAGAGGSPKPKSSLGSNVVTANPTSLNAKQVEDGGDTDDEDGQWSTSGNNPYSRQGSFAQPNFNNPPVVVTPSLGIVHEECKFLASVFGVGDVNTLQLLLNVNRI